MYGEGWAEREGVGSGVRRSIFTVHSSPSLIFFVNSHTSDSLSVTPSHSHPANCLAPSAP